MSFWTNGIFIKDKNMSVMGQRDEWSCWSSEMPESPCEGRWGGRHHGKAGGEGDLFNIGQDPRQACHSSAGRSSVTVWTLSAYGIHIITR